MASSHDTVSMALFCDFENVALGVRDAKYEKFDIKRVLERLLLKGSIVVKKAYCDWERYKGFKATMHEASFELIEIPHVRQSGKNSADIRLVVDALDLCYTKSHVNTFVIISGDSDFSPLVSKLRENAKQVIGVGVKQSTSDLLIANCDEFIFYDDLVRESVRAAAKQDAREAPPAAKRSPDEENHRREEQEKRKTQAVELAVETFEALVAERGDSGKIWASLLKEAIKRRKPGFNESYYGFRAFGNLLEEAQARGLLDLGRDEKSGAYVYRRNGDPVAASEESSPHSEPSAAMTDRATGEIAVRSGSRRRRGGPTQAEQPSPLERPPAPDTEPPSQYEQRPEPERVAAEPLPAGPVAVAPTASTERAARSGRRGHGRKPAKSASVETPNPPETLPDAEGHSPAAAAAALPGAAHASSAPAKTTPATPAPTAEMPAVAAQADAGSEHESAATVASPPPPPAATGANRMDEQQLAAEKQSATAPVEAPLADPSAPRGRQRRGRKSDAPKAEEGTARPSTSEPAAGAAGIAGSAVATQAALAEGTAPSRKPARARRPRKAETAPDQG